ncbi:MAG: type 1 glutamine amidotransferase, partial [Lentimonas sp.]
MEILCIKHIGFEGPGAIAQWAQRNGHNLVVLPIYQSQHLPSPEKFDAFVIMGGPMSVHNEAEHPWLVKEGAYIRSAIASGKHVLGVCLGAQLIAHVMGGKVTAGTYKEIGWFPIQPTEGCPTEFTIPESLKVLHWHGETFSIPSGAQPIASSAAYANQGFIYRSRVLALQCHLEMTPEGLALLAAACSHELVDGPYIQNLERLKSEP